VRARVVREMNGPPAGWENLYRQCGSPDRILLVSFHDPRLKPLTGKTLAQAAAIRGTTPEEAAMDLIVEDHGLVSAIYFNQSEDNLRKVLPLPWLGFCTDAYVSAAEGVFLKSGAHPRQYGAFPRVLAKYVRNEKLMTLQEAIRKMTSLPAQTLRIQGRGRLEEGYFADIVVFDPASVADRATYESPHQYPAGVLHVLVNGVPVVKDGEHTGAKPGRVVRGPGAGRTSPPGAAG
jgi:N-acyl-D-amino-acid deacylase